MASSVIKRSAIHLPDGCIVYAGTNAGNIASIGSLQGDTSMVHTWTPNEVKNNNGATIIDELVNQELNASFTIQELYADTINKLGGGLYTLTNIAGTPVSDADGTIASGDWLYSKFIKAAYQNADGTSPVIDTVAGSVDGALTVDVDYYITKDANGDWGITLISGSNLTTETQIITYKIDYTPTASKQLTAGASSTTISSVYLRFEHTNAAGLKRYMDVPSTILQPDVAFGFGDNANDGVDNMELSMKGRIDTSLVSGAQLFTWMDEQGV